MECEEYQQFIYLAHYGELDETALAALERHIESCPVCAAEKARVDKLFTAMDSRRTPEVDSEWLKSARNQMVAHLESTKKRPAAVYIDWKKLFGFVRTPAFVAAYSAVLMLAGIFLGNLKCNSTGAFLPSIEVGQMAADSEERDIRSILQEGNLRNVDLQELPGQQVQVTFRGTRDYQIMGSTEDKGIQDLLAYILLHESNTGLRLRSLETLAQQQDSLVQLLLQYSLLYDENSGVRLKAVRSLRNYPPTPQHKDAYLRALMTDTNDAVRIEAMEGLKDMVADEKVMEVLRIAAAKDSNDYVKLLARSALEDYKSGRPGKGTAIEDLR